MGMGSGNYGRMGGGMSERSKSRSRSRERNDWRSNSDLTNLKEIYRSDTFDLLRSPHESIKKIRASSPALKVDEVKKKEAEAKPQLQSRYGNLNRSTGLLLSNDSPQEGDSLGNGSRLQEQEKPQDNTEIN